MDGLKNYREKIKNIEKLVNKMENGDLSIHELVELESLTRDLHERSIILKYKAFEGVGAERKESVEITEPINEVTETVVESVTEDLAAAEEVVEEAVEETKPWPQEMPEMDFSLFDEPSEEEEKPEIQAPNHGTSTQNDAVEEKIEEPKPVVETKPEPVITEAPKPEVQAEIKPDPVAEEPIVVVREKGSSFLDRLSILDNSIGSQIAGRKLETLTGAFGINERLLYINELFDGSGDAFSDAIKALDTQSDLDAASAKVEELAFQNSWNPEEEVVLEFLAIIKRRYA